MRIFIFWGNLNALIKGRAGWRMACICCHKHGSVFRVGELQGYHQCHPANGFKPEECS